MNPFDTDTLRQPAYRDAVGLPDRVIGRFVGAHPGPLLVCTGAVHGDEPAGVEALQRVFAELEARRPRFAGEIVGLVGNRAAYREGRRYLDRDLNRMWLAERMRQLESAPARGAAVEDAAVVEVVPTVTVEDHEQWELFVALHDTFARAEDEIYFLDLHTSSADGEPFVCIGDTLRNRAFAMHFPVPVILGLEECVDGALLEYVNNLGPVTMGVEAGQHRRPASVEFHEAFIWLALSTVGCIEPQGQPRVAELRERLRTASGQLPSILEVRHRHPIREQDGFHMQPGFRNFQPIHEGQLLAVDRDGEITAREDGRILLPLYQGLGSDGFFITRSVRGLWLHVSALLRHLHLDAFLPWLPGVRRHPSREATLLVDPRVARWFAVELFHLLGYRKHRGEAGMLVLSRRRFDHRPPRRAVR